MHTNVSSYVIISFIHNYECIMKKFDFTAIGREPYPDEIVESRYFLIRQEINTNRTREQVYALMDATNLREKAQEEAGFAITSDYDLGLQEYLKIVGEDYNQKALDEAFAFGYQSISEEIKSILEKQKVNKKRKF